MTRTPAFPAYKLALPRVGSHVRREALGARLSEAWAAAPLTWVAGLPGSGKTSALARWVQEAQTPCCWYRLDDTDADPASLFGALASQSPRSAQLPVWSPENGDELRAFARRFFGALGADPLTLVLDDCHRVPDDSPLVELLSYFHELAGQMRVFVISRRPPPPPVARGLLGGWLKVIDDLRLEQDEAAQIATSLRGSPLSEAELSTADGWLAHLLALAHRRGGGALSGNDLGAFLAEELLHSVPAASRAALRALAELPEIPHQLLGSPLLPRDVGGLLEALATQRYFVDLVAPGRWRLHDLLRDALMQLNAREESSASLASVRAALAAQVSDVLPEAALQLFAAARDQRAVVALLERRGALWLKSGLHRAVHGWLADLPDEGHARLSLWKAQALLPLEPELARPLFARARRAAVSDADATLAGEAWCGEVASYVVQWGAVAGLAALVDELEALVARFGPFTGELAFRTSADALTALMYGRAEDPRITTYADATASAIAHAPDAGARITAASQLLIYKLWWAGDFPGGRVLYDSFDDEVARDEGLGTLPRLMWWSCASIVDWQCGEAEACYEKVERGLALAEASGVRVRDFFLLTQGIFCALSQEDWPRAERYLAQLARTERTYKRLDTMVHHFFRSWYALCRGETAVALAHAETAWPIAEGLGSMFHQVIVLSALTPARVAQGDLEGAERAYRQQLSLAKAAKNPTFSFIAFCAGAELALARGDEAALSKQVERMLMVKAMGGFHSHCGWRTSMMQAVLSFALEKGLHPEIARQWIREKQIPAPAPTPPGWPARVEIRALEGLQVKVDGLEAFDGARSAQKLKELLAILVARRDGVSQAALLDALWPESDGDRAAASLKVAIHRLRQALGAEAIRVRDGMTRLDPAVVDCDVWHVQKVAQPSLVLSGHDAELVQQFRARLARG